MTNDTEKAIRKAIRDLFPNIPIKHANMPFTKPDSGTWLELYNLGSDLSAVTMGRRGGNDSSHVYQITVVTKLNTGTKESEDILNKIASGFQIGSYIVYNETKVRVKSLSFGPSFESDGVWKSTCTIYGSSRINRGI